MVESEDITYCRDGFEKPHNNTTPTKATPKNGAQQTPSKTEMTVASRPTCTTKQQEKFKDYVMEKPTQ